MGTESGKFGTLFYNLGATLIFNNCPMCTMTSANTVVVGGASYIFPHMVLLFGQKGVTPLPTFTAKL